jgi:CRP-like cAMP-binding protein
MYGYRFLKLHSLFGGLTEEEMNKIRPLFREEKFAKNDTILRENERNDRLYFICEGSVEISRRIEGPNDAATQKIALLGVGDTFGEMELIDIQSCAATVRAIEDTVVLTLSNFDFHKISKINLKSFTLIIMNLAREISRRLRKADALLAKLLRNPENELPG